MTLVKRVSDIEDTIRSLAGVGHEIERIEQARKVRLKATHGRFNLFTTILQAHDEVRLHTRYLTHLLDPSGAHDCDGLFLERFLEAVENKAVRLKHDNGLEGFIFSDLKVSECQRVTNEHHTGDLGSIDIYIEFEKAILVIENKIWASDQPEQLERYAKYSKKQNKAVYLFYLTLDGHPPSNNSQGTLGEDDFALISYRDDVLGWVKTCLQKTYSFVNINQALQQYESVINQLLGNTLEASDMDKIKKLLKAEEGIMKHANQIAKALQAIRAERDEEFKKECCKAVGLEETDGAIKQWDCGVAVKLSNPKWGPVAQTELCGVMYGDDTYGVMAYDIPSGELKKVIDTAFGDDGWSSGSNAYTERILRIFDKKEGAMALLKEIAEKLN